MYARIVSKSGIKMKALIAVQRKLLELIYVIDNSKDGYQEDYQQKKDTMHECKSYPLQTSM